ncbi:FtsQ-type POTRA domain-containing protein [Puniceicoccaceae bacterium K14]|nr:FtsQ-type POTRA domain-containing protein [Puniceicoccaceae bacterium K14]
MSRTPAKNAKKRPRSWKDIDQGVKPKTMSKASKQRAIMGRLRWMLGFAVVVVAIGVFLKVVVFSPVGPRMLAQAGDALPVESIEINTDGVLSRDYVLNMMELHEGETDLLSLDIDVLKDRLVAIPQVRSAEVERRFPDSLVIEIEEREPVVRITARRSTGETLMLLVDGDGQVFEGEDFDTKFLRSLPALGGVSLKREGRGYTAVEGMRAVNELLMEAKAIAPHIYRTWRVVSLEDAPNIIVRSKTAKEVIFEPGNYRRSLAQLDYVLDYYRGQLVTNIATIDLTLGKQVPVRAKPLAQ